jgi:hypothetical protein
VDRLAAALLVGTAPESPDGVAVVLAGVGLVALRGYLAPGTPALTERYLPERVRLALGADHPAGESSPDPSEFETLQRVAYEREHAVDPDTFLTETGVCQAPETAGENAAPPTVDPTLTPAFAAAQDEEIATLRESGVTEAAVARAFDEDADAVAAVAADQPSYEVGNRVRTWPSRAALFTTSRPTGRCASGPTGGLQCRGPSAYRSSTPCAGPASGVRPVGQIWNAPTTGFPRAVAPSGSTPWCVRTVATISSRRTGRRARRNSGSTR